MSRAYRISLSESRNETVHVQDGVCTALEVLEVLPRQEMGELIAKELGELGFERDGQVMRRTRGGVEIAVDLSEGTVTARASSEKSLEVRAAGEDRVEAETEAARERLRARLHRDMDRQVEREKEKLSDALAEQLEKGLRDARADIDRATTRATGAALKVKAARLGEIQEVSEDPETGAVTIKVRV